MTSMQIYILARDNSTTDRFSERHSNTTQLPGQSISKKKELPLSVCHGSTAHPRTIANHLVDEHMYMDVVGAVPDKLCVFPADES